MTKGLFVCQIIQNLLSSVLWITHLEKRRWCHVFLLNATFSVKLFSVPNLSEYDEIFWLSIRLKVLLPSL